MALWSEAPLKVTVISAWILLSIIGKVLRCQMKSPHNDSNVDNLFLAVSPSPHTLLSIIGEVLCCQIKGSHIRTQAWVILFYSLCITRSVSPYTLLSIIGKVLCCQMKGSYILTQAWIILFLHLKFCPQSVSITVKKEYAASRCSPRQMSLKAVSISRQQVRQVFQCRVWCRWAILIHPSTPRRSVHVTQKVWAVPRRRWAVPQHLSQQHFAGECVAYRGRTISCVLLLFVSREFFPAVLI